MTRLKVSLCSRFGRNIGLSALYGLVHDPDFNIMQQSHGLFAIAKLLVVDRHVGPCLKGADIVDHAIHLASFGRR